MTNHERDRGIETNEMKRSNSGARQGAHRQRWRRSVATAASPHCRCGKCKSGLALSCNVDIGRFCFDDNSATDTLVHGVC